MKESGWRGVTVFVAMCLSGIWSAVILALSNVNIT